MHVIPYGVAALLLLIFSVAEDNPLRRLVVLLSTPQWVWIPAGVVTVISALVYYLTIRLQVGRAYLWPEHILRRTLLTAAVCLAVTVAATYSVLRLELPVANRVGGILASIVLSLLSLAGLGWAMPRDWVDDVGIRSPDYLRAHHLAGELGRLLAHVRAGDGVGRLQDVARVEELLSAMRDEIDTNVELEPSWAAEKPRNFSASLHELLLAFGTHFPHEKSDAFKDFPAVSKGQNRTEYAGFFTAWDKVLTEWPAWKHTQ